MCRGVDGEVGGSMRADVEGDGGGEPAGVVFGWVGDGELVE